MSRCFPFPPSGYEKKARTDDPSLLKKEKQREQKHKKEKKDKEKRENKEKKDKDGSDEKHREKKDKKEKHRDKKKDKEDKGKNSSADEKRLSGKSEGHDGEKTPNEKKVYGKSVGHNGEKFVPKEKEKDKDRNSNSGEKKVPKQFSGYSREYSQNSYLAGHTKDPKFVQESGRRVGDEDRGIGNHLAEKFAKERRDEGTVVARSTGSFDGGKEKKKDETGVGHEARFTRNDMVRNLSVQTRVEGVSKSLDKDSADRTEGKERTKQKEGDDKRGDKSKYNNREKNERWTDKEKKKEEKAKMKRGHKNIERDKLKNIKDDHVATDNKKTLHLPKDGNKNAISEGTLGKRKELETNGFCHANDTKPSKLPRLTSSHPLTEGNKLPKSASSSHPLIEINKLPRPTSSSYSLPGNGRVLEPCQTPALFTSDKGGAIDNLKAENKDGYLNGVVVSQPLSVSTARPQLTALQTDQISEVSTKPPHPDTKHLSQVLLIPKMEDCSSFDDREEWLFHSSDSNSKMPKLGSSASSRNDEIPLVWAESTRIESADVCALPYVIPY